MILLNFSVFNQHPIEPLLLSNSIDIIAHKTKYSIYKMSFMTFLQFFIECLILSDIIYFSLYDDI